MEMLVRKTAKAMRIFDFWAKSTEAAKFCGGAPWESSGHCCLLRTHAQASTGSSECQDEILSD
jgi:hypothetical protein